MKQQLIQMDNIKKLNLIKLGRARTQEQNTPELREKRDKFLNWLLIKNYDLKVLEMYQGEDDAIKSQKIIPQYSHEFRLANTRTKIKPSTRAECDKLEFDKTIDFICEICLELIKKEYHFCVFYAEGQRSPHIIIYDFYELEELNPFQREKAQAQFWRSIVPFRVHILDNGVWSDNHFVPLEFAIHWRHGTPFNLLFEWMPTLKEEQKVIEENIWEEAAKRITPFNEETKEEKIKRCSENAKVLEEAREKARLDGERLSLETKEIISKYQMRIKNAEIKC